MAGEIAYVEVPATDAAAAQRFYGQLFGWTCPPGNVPGYSMVDGVGFPAGLAGGDGSGVPRVFFAVDDVATGCARVRELGGHAEEPVSIPAGTFARCADDQGTAFTLWADA